MKAGASPVSFCFDPDSWAKWFDIRRFRGSKPTVTDAAYFLCSSELARLREAMEQPGLTLWMASAISSVLNGFLHFQ
jgi:hypothetical protein